MNAYEGDFRCWQDVQHAFMAQVPEPQCVIRARFDLEGPEAVARVIYRDGDQLRMVLAAWGGRVPKGGDGVWAPFAVDSLETAKAWFDAPLSFGQGSGH